MDYLTSNWSTLCLACAGGALGYYYQYTRPVSGDISIVYAKVFAEKVQDYLSLKDEIVEHVKEKIPLKLRQEVDKLDIFQDNTYFGRIWENIQDNSHLSWFWERFAKLKQHLLKDLDIKEILEDLHFSEILSTIKRNKLFIVFSCTGFFLVYCSVKKFDNHNGTIIRGRFRSRNNLSAERFSNPLELFLGYCLYQTRRVTEICKRDKVPSSLFVATVLLVIVKHYVKIEYHPDQDVFVFDYSKN